MDELTYEDTDDEGNPLSPRGGGRPKWQTEPIHQKELLQRVFALYGRKYFADQTEQKAWKKICKDLDKGMSVEWVESCIQWVKTRMDAGRFIPFWAFENLVLNAVKEREFMAKNKMYQREADGDLIFNPGGDGDIVGG